MAIVSDIVYRSLRLLGLRDTSNTIHMAEAIVALNNMLTSWNEWLNHTVTKENLTLVVGQGSYTIGSGGDFNTTRPLKLMSAYIRDTYGIDYEVNIHMALEEYDTISAKSTIARPNDLWYNQGNPLGTIYFDSVPETAETFVLSSIKPFSEYTALTDTILQPVEYENLMCYGLAIQLAPEHHQIPNQLVVENYMLLRAEVENRNLNLEPVPSAKFDPAMLR